MFDLIASIYNGCFMVFFAFTSLLLLYHFLKMITGLLSPDEEIKDGYVLITGCDTGFGLGAAMELNKKNMFVFAGCLTKEATEKFNNDDNFNGMAIQMNICKMDDIQNAKKIIEEKVGDKGLWCLLNNAGVFTTGPIEWLSEEEIKWSMDVNCWGAVNVTKAMLPLIKKAKGRIVNTTSIAGRIAVNNLASYHMPKYALEAFSDTLRHEMRAWGVSVHIIEPGFFATNLYDAVDKRWRDQWARQPDDIKEAYGAEFLEETLEYGNKTKDKLLGNPKYVVKAYIHAILSSRPKLRYVVGIDANTMLMAIATLPTAMGDLVHRICFKEIKPVAMRKAK